MTRYFDSHAHLQHPKFDSDRAECIQRAQELGVEWILNLATSAEDAQQVIDLSIEFDCCLAAVGTHPCDVHLWSDEAEKTLHQLAQHSNVVMFGEIGLDYFHKPFDRDFQRKVFRRQLAMARELKLPVSMHCRGEGCYDELIECLKLENGSEIGGIAHCFVGDEKQAQELLDMGLYLGVGGIATYPKNQEIRDVLKTCPKDRLLMETDSPYLAPQPKRGKRNEPAFVVETANFMAEYLDLELGFPFLKKATH